MKLAKIFSFFLILIAGILFAGKTGAVAPNAITNLECVFSEMPGAVWLTWTSPAGAATYDVRYALSPMSEGDFNLAYQFSQNWSGSATQGLVSNLTIGNRNWFFAIKSINAGGEVSRISNIAWCFVPEVVIAGDKTPPTSSITDPLAGATIPAGEDYMVKGVSSDSGGSSVQKVEISFDGGATWVSTTPKESAGTGFTFEYLWIAPTFGTYNIQTKATDWIGNVEVPGGGINVTIATQAPVVQPPGEQQTTVEELRARIAEIQQQIVQLLQELILLLQKQIAVI